MTAKFAVGDDGIAVTFLLRDDIADRFVLRLGQFIFVGLTAVEAGKDFFELRRAHQAADMVDAQIVYGLAVLIISSQIARNDLSIRTLL